MRDLLGIAWFWLYRFRALPRARSRFRSVPDGSLAERRLFDHVFICDVSKAPGQLLYLMGERFIPEATLLRGLLQPGMTVIDTGANLGYYLLLIEKFIGPNGHIIAVEPSPENLPLLRRNICANKFDNVTLHEVAVGSNQGQAALKSGTNSGVVLSGEAIYRVPIETIDSISDRKVDFIKMDIEGFELYALNGAQELLARDRPIIFLEVHPETLRSLDHSVGQLYDFLKPLYNNFRAFVQRRPKNFFDKICYYYINSSPCLVENLEDFIALCDHGEITEPFWLIVQPS